MRKESTIAALFSPTRQGVLATIFLRPEKSWYLSELAAELGTQPSSLQREVDSLVKAGILEKTRDGRRSYLRANPESPVFPELRGIVEKTSGIVPMLRQAVGKLGRKIELAFIYGSIARGDTSATSDVDLMLIGNVSMMELVSELKKLERRVGRPINPTLYTHDDFVKSAAQKNHFLTTVLKGKKIMLKGTDDELEAIALSA
jgi:predicted nucleotidyltransferase